MEVLGKFEAWLADLDDYRVFWLNGMAGTGKSTIPDSLARYAKAEGISGTANPILIRARQLLVVS